MRILIRTSQWATWARRLGGFALPLVILPVVLHRAQAVPSPTFIVVEVAAIGFAALALLVSLIAFIQLWFSGDRGWDRASTGFVLSLLCLAPAGLWSWATLKYPSAAEISTETADPPPLTTTEAIAPPPAPVLQRVALTFPNLRTRRYPIDPAQAFQITSKLVADKGWTVLASREPTDDEAGQINASVSDVLGFRGEVSIRVSAEDDGSSVAMRSASLSSWDEPGANASRVQSFLNELDTTVTTVLHDNPDGSDDSSDADQTPPTPVIPAPSPRERKR